MEIKEYHKLCRRTAETFFIKRFNRKPEEDRAYFEEWVERFKTGHPENSMDSESLKIWEDIKKEIK